MLKIEKLVKRYNGGDPVLKNLDLEIGGQKSCRSSGRPVLAKVSCYAASTVLSNPPWGSITLNGTDLTQLKSLSCALPVVASVWCFRALIWWTV